ncbi:non-homologous end joining protein Ku [Desulfolucanica intricata]|uniref:non-homologous end joining protein Ku n=1 Tax=Desulfolucanica intricata TaxID=1285191 RepID=UPI00082D78C9|nr:Ku protein [Desulfolucanica intricata]
MRPLWKGAVTFGLVYVPVKLYAATEKKDIKFNYLHEKCKTPVQYRRYCPYCDAEIPGNEIVRGYEFEKGKYVIMREEDFERLPGGATKSIDILDFVNLSEIDPVYFDRAYYLAPGEGGQKVYELLKRSMRETGKVAVAKIVIRSKESLAAIRVAENILVMSTMYYPEEVRKAAAIDEINYHVELHENEVKMAVNLINNLSDEFQPDKYTSEYRQALMEVIQSKVAGEEITPPARPEAGKVVDLMSALKASIDLAKEERNTGKKVIKSS